MESYLETSSNTVSWNLKEIFSKDIIRERLLKLKIQTDGFWRRNDLRISKQLSESILNDVAVKWKRGRRWNVFGVEIIWSMYIVKSFNS